MLRRPLSQLSIVCADTPMAMAKRRCDILSLPRSATRRGASQAGRTGAGGCVDFVRALRVFYRPKWPFS
jgi:hypothetical protein